MYLKTAFFIIVIGLVLMGIAMLALQNCHQPLWEKHKCGISLALNAVGTLLFIVSLQPYAAALLFVFLMIKAFLLIKRQ